MWATNLPRGHVSGYIFLKHFPMSVKIKKSFNMKSLLRLFFFCPLKVSMCYPCFMTKYSFLMLILILDTKSKTLWETLGKVCLAKSSARLPCLVSLIGILTETAWIGSTPLWSCKHHFFRKWYHEGIMSSARTSCFILANGVKPKFWHNNNSWSLASLSVALSAMGH